MKIKPFIEKNHRVLATVTIILIVLVCVIYGFKKHGFYIDEYYLYTVSNGTQFGIAIEPGKWNDTSDYTRQLVSEGDENFSFKQVYDTEQNGVHPPLYYYMLHFMSSVFTGKFSKWIGISLNILIVIPMLIIAYKLGWKLSGGNPVLALLTLLMFGLSPAIISMVVLVRMYLLLGLWTILYAYIHVADLERDRLSVTKFLIPAFITGFLGFITQYFFVVIMFFITFVYAFYLMVFCRRVKDAVVYGLTILVSLASTHLVWPFWYFHIFQGYRGKGAVSQIKDYSHMWDRIAMTTGWLDKLVFAHTLVIFAALLICGTVVLIKYIVTKRRAGGSQIIRSLPIPVKGFVLLAIAALLDYAVLTQVALLDGIECSRQFITTYVLFLVLIPIGLYRLVSRWTKGNAGRALIVTACSIALVTVLGHVEKNVIFLYEDEKVALDYAMQHPDAKVVMFENDDGNYDSRIQELMLYPEVYYVSVSDLSTAKDPKIAGADELLVYVSTSADPDECFNSIYDQNPKITKAELLCDCYAFYNIYILR